MSAATHKRPVIIGVTGGSGSGKTSVSRAIFDSLNGHSLLMIQEDSYYKNQDDISFDERVKVNYDHPNAFDTDLLIEQLGDLLEWKAIDIPVYDYVQHTFSAILKNAVVPFNLSLISICQRSNRCITSLSNQRNAMPTSSCRKAAKIRFPL